MKAAEATPLGTPRWGLDPYTLPYRRGPLRHLADWSTLSLILSHSRVANRIAKRRVSPSIKLFACVADRVRRWLDCDDVNRDEIKVSRIAGEGERSSSNYQAQGLTSSGQ